MSVLQYLKFEQSIVYDSIYLSLLLKCHKNLVEVNRVTQLLIEHFLNINKQNIKLRLVSSKKPFLKHAGISQRIFIKGKSQWRSSCK